MIFFFFFVTHYMKEKVNKNIKKIQIIKFRLLNFCHYITSYFKYEQKTNETKLLKIK